jgi:hypothetical protein
VFKQILLAAAIASLTLAGSSQGHCRDELESGKAAERPSNQPQSDATRLAEGLLDQIMNWLATISICPLSKTVRPSNSLRRWTLR